MVICARCGREVSPEDAVRQGSRVLCEDCLMDEMRPAKACDPWAVRHARSSMGSGAEAVRALRGLEKRLYDLVQERGAVQKDDAPKLLGAGEREVDRAFATLRHMELLRAERASDGSVLYVPFRSRPGGHTSAC